MISSKFFLTNIAENSYIYNFYMLISQARAYRRKKIQGTEVEALLECAE